MAIEPTIVVNINFHRISILLDTTSILTFNVDIIDINLTRQMNTFEYVISSLQHNCIVS